MEDEANRGLSGGNELGELLREALRESSRINDRFPILKKVVSSFQIDIFFALTEDHNYVSYNLVLFQHISINTQW